MRAAASRPQAPERQTREAIDRSPACVAEERLGKAATVNLEVGNSPNRGAEEESPGKGNDKSQHGIHYKCWYRAVGEMGSRCVLARRVRRRPFDTASLRCRALNGQPNKAKALRAR